MFESIKSAWSTVKLWFKNSETILLARLEALIGFIVVALSVADWSPLLSAGINTGFTWTQAAIIGAIMFAKGVITEWSRRLGTTEVAGHLLPSTVTPQQAEVVVKIEEAKAEAGPK